MRFCIGRIVKLSGNEGTGDFAVELLRLRNRPFHAFRSGCQYNLGAISLQQLTPFHAHRLRQRKNGFITSRRSHSRQADSRIAAGRLDNGGTGL